MTVIRENLNIVLLAKLLPPVSQVPPLTIPRFLGLMPRWEWSEAVARRREAPLVEMGVMGLLAAPVTVPLRTLSMIAREVRKQAEAEAGTEAIIREELLELGMRYEAGEIGEEEYREREAERRRRLEEIGER